MRNAITEARNVTVTFNDAVGQDIVDQTAQIAMPIDAYKAVVEQVAAIEGKYAKLGSSGVADLTDASVLITGALPTQVHVFDVTTVMATGSYNYIYVETVATSEDVSA